MAVTLDVGERDNLHPRNKREVGRRLALAALKLVYGRDVLVAGPTFLTATRSGDTIRAASAASRAGSVTNDGCAAARLPDRRRRPRLAPGRSAHRARRA